jgi:drebrin-like protein
MLRYLQGYHVQITARSDRDLTPEGIIQKVADASGAKYAGGPATSSGGPPPPISSKPKPVFTPTRIGGAAAGFNPLGSRTRGPQTQGNVDEDGWGHDAPPVTRTQLEKVESAYKPTKVNMAELTSRKPEPSRFAAQSSDAPSDVVRGGYQPVGKVDIAAIRREAKEKGTAGDDRPVAVKGAYEPVGKVDIAAIRAKAQAAPPSASSPPPAPAGGDDDERPRSLAERSAAFSQSERMTTLPKPKVANKFGGGSSFTGTKAPTPGGFSAKPLAAAAPVGTASRTFADEGGKTPAQIWAEKKGRQGGGGVISPSATGPGSIAAPVASQRSGGGGWESGYTGKKWAAVNTTTTGRSATSQTSAQEEEAQEEEPPTSPPGGVSAMRDRFKGAAPMGAPSAVRSAPEPPPLDNASKPNMGGGIPIPGLPTRPAQPTYDDDDDDVPEEQHVDIPPPPAQPRSPDPPTPDEMRSSSPIRVAMPVGRSAAPTHDDDEDDHAEPHPPLPTQSIAQAASAARSLPPEPRDEDDEPGRGAAQQAAGTASFGAAATGGHRAVVQYDYEKAEDNEVELREGETVTNIDMVDDDWWMGTNSRGETGLFPSNYVELVEGDDVPGETAAPPPPAAAAVHHEPEPPAAPAAAAAGGPTATAQYDYEAAEDNELSFPDGAKITGVVSFFGHVFPSTCFQR